MLQIHVGAAPDPSLAWVLFLLLAFLLAIIVVGAFIDEPRFTLMDQSKFPTLSAMTEPT